MGLVNPPLHAHFVCCTLQLQSLDKLPTWHQLRVQISRGCCRDCCLLYHILCPLEVSCCNPCRVHNNRRTSPSLAQLVYNRVYVYRQNLRRAKLDKQQQAVHRARQRAAARAARVARLERRLAREKSHPGEPLGDGDASGDPGPKRTTSTSMSRSSRVAPSRRAVKSAVVRVMTPSEQAASGERGRSAASQAGNRNSLGSRGSRPTSTRSDRSSRDGGNSVEVATELVAAAAGHGGGGMDDGSLSFGGLGPKDTVSWGGGLIPESPQYELTHHVSLRHATAH